MQLSANKSPRDELLKQMTSSHKRGIDLKQQYLAQPQAYCTCMRKFQEDHPYMECRYWARLVASSFVCMQHRY